MTTNNEAFEKWFIEDFKGGFPTKSLDELSYSSIRTTNLCHAWQAATVEANKRIAELESDNKVYAECNAELKEANDKLSDTLILRNNKLTELMHRNNNLREAINEAISTYNLPVTARLAEALAATPAESLQEKYNEALEKAANIAIKTLRPDLGIAVAEQFRSQKEVK